MVLYVLGLFGGVCGGVSILLKDGVRVLYLCDCAVSVCVFWSVRVWCVVFWGLL